MRPKNSPSFIKGKTFVFNSPLSSYKKLIQFQINFSSGLLRRDKDKHYYILYTNFYLTVYINGEQIAPPRKIVKSVARRLINNIAPLFPFERFEKFKIIIKEEIQC